MLIDRGDVFLWLDNNGRVQPFLIAFRVGLDGVKGDVLVALGMAAIGIAIVKGAVGFQDVVNPFLEGGDETATAAFEEHVSPAGPRIDFRKGIEGHAVGFKLFCISYQPPHQAAGRHCQRFPNVDDAVGHYYALFSDSQS